MENKLIFNLEKNTGKLFPSNNFDLFNDDSNNITNAEKQNSEAQFFQQFDTMFPKKYFVSNDDLTPLDKKEFQLLKQKSNLEKYLRENKKIIIKTSKLNMAQVNPDVAVDALSKCEELLTIISELRTTIQEYNKMQGDKAGYNNLLVSLGWMQRKYERRKDMLLELQADKDAVIGVVKPDQLKPKEDMHTVDAIMNNLSQFEFSDERLGGVRIILQATPGIKGLSIVSVDKLNENVWKVHAIIQLDRDGYTESRQVYGLEPNKNQALGDVLTNAQDRLLNPKKYK